MRFLTWNIQWGRGIDGVVDLMRVADYLRRQDADVICLQEVSASMPDLAGCSGEDQFARLATLFPDYACAVGDSLRQGSRRFGNMVLSRFELLQELLHPLPWLAHGERSIPRSALEVMVRSPLGPLRIVTTHLEYFSSVARQAQVQALSCIIDAAHRRASWHFETGIGPYAAFPQSARTILMGDFNMRRHDPAFQAQEGLLFDAWIELHSDVPHPPSFCISEQIYGEPHCCDFIFVSEGVRPFLRSIHYDTQTRLSDHQPVSIVLGEAGV